MSNANYIQVLDEDIIEQSPVKKITVSVHVQREDGSSETQMYTVGECELHESKDLHEGKQTLSISAEVLSEYRMNTNGTPTFQTNPGDANITFTTTNVKGEE